MVTHVNQAVVDGTRNSSNDQEKVKKPSLDAVFNLHYAGGNTFPLSYWMRADHTEEAAYIEHFGAGTMKAYTDFLEAVKDGTLPANSVFDKVSTLVCQYVAKATYVPVSKVIDTSGNIRLDTEGNVVKPLLKREIAAIEKAAKEHLVDDTVSAAKRKKYQDYDDKYGEILGWMRYWFVTGSQTSRGKITAYQLHSVPRGQTLRLKIGGHGRAHNDLIVQGEKLHVLQGKFAYADPTRNIHITTSAGRKFSDEVLV